MLKRTPLYNAHQKLGARLIEFGGWEMPVQYTSIIDEHQAVRTAAGIFDIAHMGEVLVNGPAAAGFLNGILTNDIRKLETGLGQYTILCNEQGGAVDDLYAYRLADNEYLLIINASRIDNDVPWMQQQLAKFANSANVKLQNVSDTTAAIAVQGPRVKEFIDQCFPGNSLGGTKVSKLSELKKNQIAKYPWGAEKSSVWIGRTGYTGEDGFEIVAPANVIESIWDRILETGKTVGIKPAGLGARDTLRTEVCYTLYGHELDENTTPIDAGVGFFVALEKGNFVGRSILAQQKAEGAKKKLVAFKMSDKSAPPRPHYPIWNGDKKIGEVTSGTQSPSLGLGIGLGYVAPEFAKAGTTIEIEIRGRRFPAQVVPKPIYRKPA
ncbi:MAG: glycine cleavage system aminomethyltransferase GcvT [Limisphaerales bacterium]